MGYALGMCTNYSGSTGDVGPKLEKIAAAGFTHVLWGDHAWHDYLYTDPEIEYAARCLERTGLKVNDLHCPTGKDQRWGSGVEHERLAGVESLKNRIRMASRLGCDVIVCHTPTEPEDAAERTAYWDRQRRTLEALRELAGRSGVRLAMENTLPGNFDTLERFLEIGGAELVGVCYDSGHGNAKVDWPGNGLERFERIKSRVIDLHLHDNDGTGDLHWMLFRGTTDWARLATLAVGSGYRKTVVPLEVVLEQSGLSDETAFLRQAAEVARRLAGLFDAAAQGKAR